MGVSLYCVTPVLEEHSVRPDAPAWRRMFTGRHGARKEWEPADGVRDDTSGRKTTVRGRAARLVGPAHRQDDAPSG
ncbi:hypothetical protein, partial [Myxococcus vastator]|uniref:hypothetical protein n=1 Tax=Myxococcus vastator TaxID=2709664 RepID=UPI0019676501